MVEDMYLGSETHRIRRGAPSKYDREFLGWCTVALGLHQGSALIPFLFAIVMDRLTDEVRQEFPWTMLFADDTVVVVAVAVCRESRGQVEETLHG